MIDSFSYRKAFFLALGLHVFLITILFMEHSTKRPVLRTESKNTSGVEQPVTTLPQHELVKAIHLDNQEVMETVNRLKQERVQQQRAEQNRQRDLNRQIEAAKQERLKEQEQLARLREESNKIAIARKKQMEEEKKHLKELAEKQALEAKRIEELKKEKQELVNQKKLESLRLAQMHKKKLVEDTQANKLQAEHAMHVAKEKTFLAKAEIQRKKQAQAAAAQQAAQNAEKQARLSGEVNKYKALIVNAIGRSWIVPEHIDSSLSSQFRIRLAPDGMVLDVSLIRSSGDPLLDRSAQTAIYKASPLPVPTDAETFSMFRDISLTVRPEQVRG